MQTKLFQVSLRELLDEHSRSSTRTELKQSLGDGYRYQHETMYRHIRDASKRFGVTYSPDDRIHKFTFGDVSLKNLLLQFEIPVRKSTRFAQDFADSASGARKVSDLLTNPIQFDYLLHESLHCITWRLLHPKAVEISPVSNSLQNERDFVLKMLFLESMSVAADYLAHAEARSDIHQIFQTLSSAHFLDRKSQKNCVRLIDLVGFEQAFKFTTLANLYGNFLVTKTKPEILRKIWTFMASEFPARRSDRAIFEFILSETLGSAMHFRTKSANAFFNFCGVKRPVERLVDFDFVTALRKRDDLLSVLEKTAQLLQFGVGSIEKMRGAA